MTALGRSVDLGAERAADRGPLPVRPSALRPTASGSRLRSQPPAYSPISGHALLLAAKATLGLTDRRAELSHALAVRFLADRVELTGSGTQALELGIRSAWWRVGSGAPSIVALPAFTCYDVATAAVGSGLSIALYDVDPDTLAPDLDSLRAVLSSGVRIVVAAHLCGFPIDWNGLLECVRPFGATVVEDAAQGHGARWWERPVGALGSLSVVSFGRGKGWTGCRGGALLSRGALPPDAPPVTPAAPTSRDEWGTVGTALAQWWLGGPAWYWLPAFVPGLGLGETRYSEPAALARMTLAAAALIQESDPLATTEMFARRSNAWELLARLPFSDHVRPVRRQLGGDPGFLRLPVRLSRGWSGFADPAYARRLGVTPGYPAMLGDLPAVRTRLAGPSRRWLGAETLVRELVTLPTHSLLTPEDRAAVVQLLERYH